MFCAITCLDNLLLCQCARHNREPLFPVLRRERGRNRVATQHAQSPDNVAAMHKSNSVIKAAHVCAYRLTCVSAGLLSALRTRASSLWSSCPALGSATCRPCCSTTSGPRQVVLPMHSIFPMFQNTVAPASVWVVTCCVGCMQHTGSWWFAIAQTVAFCTWPETTLLSCTQDDTHCLQ